ncbi:MAG TPA: hypothetical protein VHB68_21040 [Steroidobacteraceae bacterium]|nr:hypothetical protein [Steroidobacteraceae bacterium]
MFTAETSSEAHEMLQLSRAERLLLTALRRLVLGWSLCTGISREFQVICGPGAAAVIATLRIFLGALDCTARRRLIVAPPGWFAPTADERHMLAILAAAQCADEGRLRALVCWFARPEAQSVLVRASHELAEVLATNNLRVAARRIDAEEPTASRGALRLVS